MRERAWTIFGFILSNAIVFYPGKILTSADFQAEQDYLSLLVENGAAIDGLGRGIVLETSVVRKLSAMGLPSEYLNETYDEGIDRGLHYA